MKNKRGYTLIELLAVIVILAIIALIAVPQILNMINDARKSAVIESTYGYIEAVENYQAYEMLKGKKGLIEGQYNISEDTIIKNTKYEKLNNIINIKGKRPISGTIGITTNGTVGTATICINNYIVEYASNKAEIISEDCGEMGAIVTYNISSEEWETKKTLEILYPEGKYEYYYKLESGKAKVGEKELIINEEIELDTNTVNIEILENSKITAWMVKDGKKLSLRTYEETKIDNVELGEISATVEINYPTLTSTGFKDLPSLTLTYEEQEGTSAYYSVDGGNKWTRYNRKITVSSSDVKAKLVRDKSGKEGNIVTATISTATTSDALPIKVYDGDDSSSIQNSKKYYFNVDSSAWNKYLRIVIKHGNTSRKTYYKFYDKDGILLKTETYNSAPLTVLKTEIPENTIKIERTATDSSCILYEIGIYNQPIIKNESFYPTLSVSGWSEGYDNITLNYDDTSIQRLYRIDAGEWQDYKNDIIKLEIGQTIEAKGIINNEVSTIISSHTAVEFADALPDAAYDNDESTEHRSGSTYYFNVDSSAWNKYLKLMIRHGNTSRKTTYYFYDKNGEILKTVTYNPAAITTIYEEIPVNTVLIKRTATDANCIVLEIGISETKG